MYVNYQLYNVCLLKLRENESHGCHQQFLSTTVKHSSTINLPFFPHLLIIKNIAETKM